MIKYNISSDIYPPLLRLLSYAVMLFSCREWRFAWDHLLEWQRYKKAGATTADPLLALDRPKFRRR